MTSPLRWGVLGAGHIARNFVRVAGETGHTVAGVGSRDAEKAAAFAAELGVPASHGSYRSLVESPDVDLVYVATPHPFHAEHALLALEAGKHVLVEKPFTLTAAEARAVLTRADELGLVALHGMWSRFLPHMRRVRELIAEGRIGEVVGVVADHTQPLTTDPAHRINALALGGGALLDLGVYPVAFALDVLGDVAELHAFGRLGPTGADEHAVLTLRSASGAIGVAHTSSRAPGDNSATVFGTEARVEFDRVFYQPTTVRVVARDGAVLETIEPTDGRNGFRHQMDELERLVAAGETESPALIHAHTVRVMELLDEARAQLGVRYPQEDPAR